MSFFLLLVAVFALKPLCAQITFSSPDSAFAFAERNSNSSKVSAQQSLLAKWTKVAALANTVNFRNPVSFSSTNNLLLPVNFIPAEAFNGPSGSFRQITLGQQYVSNFNFNPQLDIINPQNWARVKSSELNQEMTEVNNQLVKKSLRENIAAAYYNCIGLQDQIKITKQNLSSSDSIILIAENKVQQGIAREQDLNNARVNALLVKDKLQQLEINLSQQLNTLKILCDIPANTPLAVNTSAISNASAINKTNNNLEARYANLQSQYAKSELNANRLAMMPVLSLIYYQGWQQNSNASFFDNNAKWIESKYLGFKLTVPFPPDVNRLSQNYTNKINYRISALNASHLLLQNELSNRSLELDSEKYAESVNIAIQISELKNNNYRKSLNQFKEGLLSTEMLLNAFTEMLNSQLNLASVKTSKAFSNAKIAINNSLK